VAVRLRQMAGWGVTLRPMVAVPAKRADALYLSREWRALVKRIKQVRGCYCCKCGAGGKGVRIIGDHIVEVKDGGAELDEANVQLLCMACHNSKTAAARRARAGGA
jgi:5-methylcytosine-specific restriction enzyme A